MKKLLLGLVFSSICYSQITYTLSKTTVLSGSAEVLTVQQPASAAKTVNFVSAYVDSSSACAITIERNGTAASSTSLTPQPANPLTSAASTATGWSASNVGTGTVITRANVNPAIVVDLSRVRLSGSGTGINLTVRTASCTATVNIVITYTESN